MSEMTVNYKATTWTRTGWGRKDEMAMRRKLNLQFFAEGGDGAGAAGEGSGTEGAQGAAGAGTGATGTQETELKTFDDLLKDKDYQAEFDRRVNKAIETAKGKWQLLVDDKVSEAEKLSKMTKDEKAQYLLQKREKELSEKEAAITRRELMAEAKNALVEKNLPAGLAEVLSYADADACKKSIEAVEKAFQAAVEAAVQERLKGGAPDKVAPENTAVTKEQYAKMGYAERLKLKTENPELYQQLSGN